LLSWLFSLFCHCVFPLAALFSAMKQIRGLLEVRLLKITSKHEKLNLGKKNCNFYFGLQIVVDLGKIFHFSD
jgi:hypothetical protein